jgi:hypothetical protein
MNKIATLKYTGSKNQAFFDLLESLIVCKFDLTNCHLISKAIILPCGYTVCKDCIQNSIIRFGFIKCNFSKCTKKHNLNSIDSLFVNKAVDEIIENNLKYFAEFFVEELKQTVQYKTNNNKNKGNLFI